ncbi:uncharacterized protein SAPINGB_P003954 [Magnusiomyces paraingens]|uniref:Calponin-homology (CH) domain-containing protein n=1 Tax=Magnusiomyces paraingens TaxID=2606893 RepID=A0A5E8BZF1_9ASCO|nr:uncharacterized protein SAPINGB_P003954 [Saprochaete ingens]VVT54195.1 unnamed protein product [Saprochaete ingens]
MSSESRQELVNWVNSTLQLNISKVDECGKGFVYCQLLDSIYRDIPLKRVNFRARNEYEYLSNFKILQAAFTSHGIDRPIEVDRLAKCRLQDNLEFLQWFKRFWDANYPTGTDYDAAAVRSSFGVLAPLGSTSASSSPASSSSLGPRLSSTSSRSPSVSSGRLSAVGSARPTSASRPSVTGQYRSARPTPTTTSSSSSTTPATRLGSSAASHSRTSTTPHHTTIHTTNTTSSSRLSSTHARTTGRSSAVGTHTGPASTATAAGRHGGSAATGGGRLSAVGVRSVSALGAHSSSASAAAAAAAVSAAREEAAAAQQAATEAQAQVAALEQELEETRQEYGAIENEYHQLMDHAELVTSEREFYFSKLREIEILMQSVSEMLKKKEEQGGDSGDNKKSNGDGTDKNEGEANGEKSEKKKDGDESNGQESGLGSTANGKLGMLEPKIFVKAIMDILYSTAEGFEAPNDTIMEVDNEDTLMPMEGDEEETF